MFLYYDDNLTDESVHHYPQYVFAVNHDSFKIHDNYKIYEILNLVIGMLCDNSHYTVIKRHFHSLAVGSCASVNMLHYF